jgi:hypothetical protein
MTTGMWAEERELQTTRTPGSGAARTHAHVVRDGAVDTCNIGHRHLAGGVSQKALALSCDWLIRSQLVVVVASFHAW